MNETPTPTVSMQPTAALRTHGITVADLAATGLFAFEGAALAAVAGLDLFGVLVVACVSSLGGGTIRDLLIGDVPTASVSDARYLVVAPLAGAAAFVAQRTIGTGDGLVLVTLDAAGLALFALVGAVKAFDRRLPVLACVAVGTITAVGGGIIRDVLLDEIPRVLRQDVYATAALAGAAVAACGLRAGMPRRATVVVAAVVCFGLRMVAYQLRWNLPA